MKIGIVSESYYPAIGGISEHVANLAQALRAKGHCVKIVTTSYGEYADAPFNCENVIRVGKSLNFQKNGSQAHIAYGRHLSRQLREVFEKEKFDVLHVQAPEQPTLPLLSLLSSNTVNVGTFHATYDRSLPLGICRPYVASALSRLHGRIVVSESALASIKKYFPEGKYELVPNGIDFEKFSSGKALPQYTDRPNILFVGNFVGRKGFVNLVEAFPLVKKTVPSVRFIAVGDGVLRSRYEKKLKGQMGQDVIFTGRVSSQELPNYYATAQVYCTPATSRESFGIVNLEAMAAGAPVVASDISGYRCLLGKTKAAILIRPNDVRALADALIKVISDPVLAKTMSEAGRCEAKKYCWETVAGQVEQVYKLAFEKYPVHASVMPGWRWLNKLGYKARRIKKAETNE